MGLLETRKKKKKKRKFYFLIKIPNLNLYLTQNGKSIFSNCIDRFGRQKKKKKQNNTSKQKKNKKINAD